ncbi:MAG: PH domain-containing protein [Myxococcota bacterium]|nr:PH domain-containing protein [Myxococcota bacterium]
MSEPKKPNSQKSPQSPFIKDEHPTEDLVFEDSCDLSEEETGAQPVRPTPMSAGQSIPGFLHMEDSLFDPFLEDDYSEEYTSDISPEDHTEQFEVKSVFVPPPLAQRSPDSNPGFDHKADETPWQGLHVASLVINLLPQAWRTLRVGWPLLLALFFSTGNSVEASINFVIILAFFGMTLLRTLTHFLTLRYRIHESQLEVKEGLVFQKFRSLSPNRIQNTEVVQNPLHKLMGLVELRIETAGSSSDGLISAITRDTADALISELQVLSKADTTETDEPTKDAPVTKPDFESGLLEAVLFGLSKRTAGTIAVLSIVGMELLSVLEPQDAQEVTRALDWTTTIGLFLIAFGGSWLWSAGRAVLNYGVFRIYLKATSLKSEEGLLTRRKIEIPRSKIQLLTFSQPLMRRLMGYGSLYIETAALGMADGEVRASEVVVPMLEIGQFPQFTQKVTPYLDVKMEAVELKPAHPRAFYRMAIGGMMRSAAIAGFLLWYLNPSPVAWLTLLLIPLAIVSAYLDWSRQGWLITPKTIMARWGFFSRSTILLARDKIQSVHLTQTPIMRWHGLGRIVISVANSRIELPDIGIEEAHEQLLQLRSAFTETKAS